MGRGSLIHYPQGSRKRLVLLWQIKYNRPEIGKVRSALQWR